MSITGTCFLIAGCASSLYFGVQFGHDNRKSIIAALAALACTILAFLTF